MANAAVAAIRLETKTKKPQASGANFKQTVIKINKNKTFPTVKQDLKNKAGVFCLNLEEFLESISSHSQTVAKAYKKIPPKTEKTKEEKAKAGLANTGAQAHTAINWRDAKIHQRGARLVDITAL